MSTGPGCRYHRKDRTSLDHLLIIVISVESYLQEVNILTDIKGCIGACIVTVTKDMLIAESDKQAKKKKKIDTDLAK